MKKFIQQSDMKNGKATGIDDIPAEFLKMLEGEALRRLVKLCKEIYNTGMWPVDFVKTVIYRKR